MPVLKLHDVHNWPVQVILHHKFAKVMSAGSSTFRVFNRFNHMYESGSYSLLSTNIKTINQGSQTQIAPWATWGLTR